MLIASAICISIASLIFAILNCFFGEKKAICFFMTLFSLVALICSGLTISNIYFNFSGYNIILILSVAVQFFNLIDIERIIANKNNKYLQKNNGLNLELNKKQEKTLDFLKNSSFMLNASTNLVSGFLVAFGGLYLGLETAYSFILGISVGIFASCTFFLTKKTLNNYAKISYFVTFLSIGLLWGQIFAVLFYSFALKNILYCISCLILSTYFCLKAFLKNKYIDLLYYVAMLLIFATTIV